MQLRNCLYFQSDQFWVILFSKKAIAEKKVRDKYKTDWPLITFQQFFVPEYD